MQRAARENPRPSEITHLRVRYHADKLDIEEDDNLRNNVIKAIVQIAINTAAITIAYKLGEKRGYNDGWNEGAAAGVCAKCVFDGPEDCADIPDFEGIYS